MPAKGCGACPARVVREEHPGATVSGQRPRKRSAMIYVKLGRTGLDVSRICLGCMSYGNPATRTQPWSLGEKESLPFFRQAIELGINFFDTANVYSLGASEEITGRALKEYARRDEIVLATKVYSRM